LSGDRPPTECGIAALAAFLMGDAWTARQCFARRRC